MACLSPEQLAEYAAGHPAGDGELQRHVESCEECRSCVAALVRAQRADAPPAATPAATTPAATLPPSTSTESVVVLPRSGPQTAILQLGPEEYTRATLREEEVRTARTMIWTGRVLGLVSLAPLPVLGGSTPVRLLYLVTVIIAVIAGIIIERRLRDPKRYTEATMTTLGLLVIVAGLFAMLYYGIFSAAQLFPVLLLYFFSRRERFDRAFALYGTNAIGQAILAALVIGGVIDDPGRFEPHAPWQVLLIGHVLIQIGQLSALVVGWQSRGDTRAAIESMHQVMILAARRQALLQEVKQDLERAIRVGGPGRYTDQRFGSYVLGNVLGRGGMGEVYEARHATTGAAAAVKLLVPRELGNPRTIERFVRELRVVSALRSPHVVRVLETSAEHDPVPFLVMERLSGQTLAELLRGSLEPAQLLALLDEAGAALEEAWSHGVVHRDLKPHNLFYAVQGNDHSWKVLDFGVAALSDGSGSLTQGHVVGTPAYMAPEQARGERVDHRADLYALAAIAYRWLTGQPVCTGADTHALLYQVVHGHPLRPSTIAELHADVDAVLAIGLAKDPAARWSRVAELRDALASALVGRLDPALRQRAADVVALYPWGTRPS